MLRVPPKGVPKRTLARIRTLLPDIIGCLQAVAAEVLHAPDTNCTGSAALALPVAAQVSAGVAGAAEVAAPGNAALSPFHVDGDGIAVPLGGAIGDAARGRAIVAERRVGLCLLCHAAPIPEQRGSASRSCHCERER